MGSVTASAASAATAVSSKAHIAASKAYMGTRTSEIIGVRTEGTDRAARLPTRIVCHLINREMLTITNRRAGIVDVPHPPMIAPPAENLLNRKKWPTRTHSTSFAFL